jgi:hypothetical protein
MKNSVAGGIDGKDDYSALITSMAGVSSRISAIETTNHAEIDKLNELLQRTDISTVVIVPSHTSIDTAQTLFPGASIYTVEEAKGLEFDVVVKYGFYNSDDALLKEVDIVYRNGGYSSNPQNRSKERNSLARSNSLYFHKSFVAATRTMIELIVVDDVVARKSFPFLWAELKGDISVSHEISTSQSSSEFSQLPCNEQISTLSAKISEFIKTIHDDRARGITRNIDALERNMIALIHQREFIVEQAVDTADMETLWSIMGLGEALNSDIMKIIAVNPNANIEILEQMLGHINDVSIFEQLLAREDILNKDERRVDFITSVLRVMTALKDNVSSEELSSLEENIERTKGILNSLHYNLISNSTLISSGVIDDVLLRISRNDFTSTVTLNTLMGQCLYHRHIDVVIDICNHKNADSNIIQMAAGYLQGAETISFPLAKAIMLSTHTNEGIITDIIVNKAIDLEFKQATIQQSRFKSNINIVVAIVSAKRNEVAAQVDTTKDKKEKKQNPASKKGKNVNKKRNPPGGNHLQETSSQLAIKPSNQTLSGTSVNSHIQQICSMLNKYNFASANKHLEKKELTEYSGEILATEKVLDTYMESKKGMVSLNILLKNNKHLLENAAMIHQMRLMASSKKINSR